MKVLTICNKCSSEEDDKKGIMKEEGPLYRNHTFKTESQNYKCPDCGNQITVAIDWKELPDFMLKMVLARGDKK